MKKNIIITALMALMAIGVYAQGQDDRPAPGPGGKESNLSVDERAKRQTDKLSALVELTPDQYNKVLAINKDFIAQRAALKPAPGQEMSEEAREKSKELNKAKDEKIKAVLTPGQAKKWQEARKEEHGHGGGMR